MMPITLEEFVTGGTKAQEKIEKATKKNRVARKMILKLLRDLYPRSFTYREIDSLLALDHGISHRRLPELEKKGLVRVAGSRKLQSTGRRARVWQAIMDNNGTGDE